MRSWTILGAALLGACSAGDDGGSFSLDVRGEDFADGVARVAVTRVAVNETIACETAGVAGGNFEVQLGRIIQPAVGHRVDAFVDVDGDQRCEFGVDAVMSLDLAPFEADADVTFPAGRDRVGDDPRGCAAFGGVSYRLTVSGLTRSVVRYALVRLNATGDDVEQVVALGAGFTTGGQAVIDLEGAGAPGRFYRIDFFEADSVDAACDSQTVVRRVEPGAAGQDEAPGCAPPAGGFEFAGDISTSKDFDGGACASFVP